MREDKTSFWLQELKVSGLTTPKQWVNMLLTFIYPSKFIETTILLISNFVCPFFHLVSDHLGRGLYIYKMVQKKSKFFHFT